VRVSAGLLTVLCAGVLCQQALGDEPPAPSQPSAPAAATSTAEQGTVPPPAGEKSSAAAPAAPQNAAPSAPASTSVKPGLTVVGTKPEVTPEDKELMARGYKLEMRHGEKYFCRREQQIGSRFETKSCNTAESIEAQRLNGQEAMRSIQSDRPQIGK
jgi:hypothetical protein